MRKLLFLSVYLIVTQIAVAETPPTFGKILRFKDYIGIERVYRVIAVAGDCIEAKAGAIYRNGKRLCWGRFPDMPMHKLLPDTLAVVGTTIKDSRRISLIWYRINRGKPEYIVGYWSK